MNRSQITQNRLFKALLLAFAIAVCAGTTLAAAPKNTNQIHAVDVVQRGGKTVVTVKGTSRPMYTAFKLSTPKRLVLDLANSSVKGVPSLLEKSTALVGGVAVSEFTTGKVKVSRVMINFKQEASYRVKVKGNTLEVTLSGGPEPAANNDVAASEEQVISLANAEERIEQAEKSADERVAKLQEKADAKVRDAQKEADARVAKVEAEAREQINAAMKKAQQEIDRARNEATDAKKEVAEAKAQIASAQKEVKAAQSGADDAESKWRMARAEISKLRAKQAHYDKKLKEAQQETVTAQAELERLAREQEQTSSKSAKKINQAEKDAAERIASLTRQVNEAEQTAQKEQDRRTQLEQRLAALKTQLDSVKSEVAQANREKNEAERAVDEMKSSVKTAFMEKESAKRQAQNARDAQRDAEKAYRVANKKDRDYLYRKLQERQKETVEAKKRFVDAENRYGEIDEKLTATMQSLKMAERKSQRAEDALTDAKNKISQQREAYERKLANLGDAVEKAEQRARTAQLEKEKVTEQFKAEKERILAESRKWKKDADDRLKAAEQRVADSEAAAADAHAKNQGILAKIDGVEKRLDDANKTIVEQKLLIAELQKKSDKASEAAKKAEKERMQALKRAEEASVRAEEERKSASLKAEKLRKETEAVILEKQQLAAQMAKQEAEAITAQEISKKAAGDKSPENVARAGAEEAKTATSNADSTASRKPTQEELRLQRLAELEKKYGKTPGKASAKRTGNSGAKPTAPQPQENLGQNAIQDIKFVNKGSSQKVVINGSGEFKYEKSEKNSRVVTMEFSDARLLPMLERTLDVRDFGGVIESISSFRQDDKVRVEVKLGRHAKNKVSVSDGAIEWLFTDAQATGDTAAPLGSASRVVHREKDAAYAYPTERTAAYSVTLADLSQRKERYTGRRIDLDFKNADIHNILRLLADVGHVNIITSDDVSGSVTIRMRDVPWDQALDVILQTKGLGKVKQGNLIRVAPLAVLEAEYEKAIERIKMNKEMKPLETRLIPVSYATAGELMPRAQDLISDRGKLSVDARTNVIIARDVAEILDQIEALIRNLDTQTPQVLIEGRIVEATSTFAREIGIQWGGDFAASSATGNPTGLGFPSSVGVAGGATDGNAPIAGLTPVAGGQPNPNFAVNLPAATGTGSGGALGISLGSISNNANLNLRLSAMEEEGTLRILSSPKILTLDNRQAHIEQGTMIPYSRVSANGVQTSFKEAKLNLTVTPHVTADGSVLLDINMTRDEPDFNNKGARGDPTILKREAKTELLVNDGHTAVIGGIFTRNHGRSYKKVPFFGDIPILGWLFKSRSDSDRRSEMLIFITPTIVNRAESIGQ
ncbi:MAG: type IV pilus secretin PilQ [Deltaproteobacteria bacterium]|nr:type IV pilus secretin PilQ [Deltaproteobacteria bacterium]